MSPSDTANHLPHSLLLSPGKAARTLRVARLKALYEAGLFRVDIASLARAMMRRARTELFAPLASPGKALQKASGLDRHACA